MSKVDGDVTLARFPTGDSFVADGMVEAVVLGNMPTWNRTVDTESLILAAEDDFAGWMPTHDRQAATRIPEPTLPTPPTPASVALPFRFDPTACQPTAKRRATPPSVDAIMEAGFGNRGASGHRWWIPGSAAILAFGVFSLLILNQSLQHNASEASASAKPFAVNDVTPVKPVPPVPTATVATADSPDLR